MKKAGILGFVLCFLLPSLFAQNNYNLSFANPSSSNGRFCVDVFMSFSDPGNLGSCNLMFDFDPALLSNPVLESDNISDPPFYLVPNISEPATGRASLNIELAVTTFGDAINASPDSSLIGRICFDVLDSTQSLNLNWYVAGTIGTVVYLDDEATILSPGTLRGISFNSCPPEGTACDDGDRATENDQYNASCQCVGTPCPPAGTTCDDGDSTTTNDVEDGFCNCGGAPCPVAGTVCDDGDSTTTNDVEDGSCGCAGTPCPTAGTTCDDGDPNTTNDVEDGSCNCAGTPLPPPPPANLATTYNLSFGNATTSATSLCADIFMSFDGAGSLGSSNLMFDFDPALVNNATYTSDNISDPPFYLVPNVSSPAAGRASFNIELAVTGFGDSIFVAPDSFLIGNICLDLLDSTQTIDLDWFVNGTVGSVVYLDDETTILTAGTLIGLSYTAACPVAGTVCDDGDSTTTNDVEDGSCNCVGTPCPVAGTVCDDGDSTTTNDVEDGSCNCVGTPCPVVGTVCDDGDSTTTNDVEDGSCNCVGTPCPTAGTACDDGNANTINDVEDGSCNCAGTPLPPPPPVNVATTYNLSFGNATTTATSLCADIFMSFDGAGKLGSANLMFDFDPAMVNNATYTSDNISDPPFYLVPNVSSPAAGRSSFNIELAVTGFGDSIFVAPDSFLIGNICLDLLDSTQTIDIDWFVNGTVGSVVYLDDETTILTAGTLRGLSYTAACPVAGTVCDDGDSTTTNDVEDGSCNCVGTPCPVVGTVCDDGDSTTTNDVEDGSCNCVGTPCPVVGTVCDDGDSTTTNDVEDGSCNCVGTPCPTAGTACDDGNANTINDVEDGSCNCAGTPLPPPPPANLATTYNLSFGNATTSATSLCADIFMSFDGAGKLGSSNLMFDFDPALVNNATYTSDNISDPPFYLVPNVSSPAAGRASFNIELAVTGFGDSIFVAPDSFLIGNICLDLLDSTQTIDLDWFVNGTVGSVVYLDDETTILTAGTLIGLSYTAACPVAGTVCDDGDSTTTNDVEDGNCNCVGTPCPVVGTVCDDGDSTTTNDVEDGSCNCVGTPCPVVGTVCDDGDSTTTNDVEDGSCNCVGTPCPTAGTACDDGNANTINDVEDGSCNCAGTPLPPPPPVNVATTYNLSFGNATTTATSLCADIFMSFDGAGKLGSANLMFDFDPALVNNATYTSDNISDPPFYLVPNVSSPAAGRASFNIELAVTGFGDSIFVAPDSFLIGNICLDLLDSTQTINLDWFVNGTVGSVVYLDDETTILTAGTLRGLSYTAACPVAGTVCDDGDSTTTNDVEDGSCNCVGTPCPVVGTVCDDGDSTTTNDVEDGSCNCVGTPCPVVGTVCDDGDSTTTNDVEDGSCNCVGTPCPTAGTACDDGNANTINDVEDGSCNCAGTPLPPPPPVNVATTYNLSFGNATTTATSLCADIFMSFDGAGSLGSANLMFDFDPALVNNATYTSDNISDPPFYLVPNVSSPAAGRASFNIELAVTGFGDSIFVAPDSFLIGNICLDLLDSTQTIDIDWFVNGTVGSVVYLDDETTILTAGTLIGLSYTAACPVAGTVCDDGDSTTTNDVEDGSCNCVGTPCPVAGTVCDDGDSTTTNDVEDGSCNCVGTPCPVAGTVCDDGDSTTTNDIEDGSCNCVGTPCPTAGTACDDGNANTINDVEDGMCNCAGTPLPPPPPGTPATAFNLCFANPTVTATTLSADIYMSYDGVGSLGSSNLMFDFDPAVVNNAVYVSDNLSNPPVYLIPTVSSPAAGRASYNIELAVTGFGDSISVAPDSFLIGRISLDRLDTTQAINVDWFVNGTAGTVVYLDDESTVLNPATLKGLSLAANCPPAGTVCDDGDSTTTNDVEDGNCNCVGTPCPIAGTVCDDGDSTTTNDIEDGSCNCVGTPCPVAGTTCDDGNANTINDVEDGMCNCAGTPLPPPPPGTPATAFNLCFANPTVTATTLSADIYMSYDGVGSLGSSNLMFDFDPAVVNNAVYVSDNLSNPPVYLIPTVSSPAAGRASYNIELAVTGFGDSISVAPDSFLIGRISLDRLDTTQAINVDWFVNGTAGTVVYLDDESTVLNPATLKGLSLAANCPPAGTVCDDGDSTTTNDVEDGNCNCVGTPCPIAGTVCDDGDSTTTNDVEDGSCNCVGTPCPVAGTTCDDGNANTINDVEDGMCNCAGTPLPPPPPGTPATAFNLCFANPTLTTTTLSADIYMSYDGVGSLGSSNLMFDFDPAIVNNAMYVSDNLSNPPFYLTPTVSSPSAGRGSFNIELAVTGFGDSISVAPDSFLIGRISLDRLDTTQAINVDWFVNGTAGTVVYLDDESTVLNPATLKGLSLAANCPPAGTVCDDGDSTTTNDVEDGSCNCVGTPCPVVGTVCDDGDSTTTNDVEDGSCNCVGTPCPVAGTTCDDGNANTINDVEDGMCNCAGTPLPPPPPGTPATAFNLCFANPTVTATTLSADIYMSYDGVGSLGSSNLMFDFDPAIVNNAMYVSDNLSNPPFYLTPTVSSPSAGRGSFNIELAVTGFGDSISIAPDSFLIGRISLDVLDTTQAINVDWFVNGTAGTVVYLDDEATVLNAANLKGLSIAANCPPQGSVCDDGDSTTINDMYDANCNCVGTACPPAGTVCDDGDSTTTNDMYDASCNCVGTPCPVAGTTCDDGNANTINDVEDGMCNCAGTPLPPPPPGTPATAFNLCFANPTLTTTTLSADIYMSYDGVGSLGSSNLMFDFDPAIVNNAVYVSDNLSNPPVYLIPTVSSPAAGRASYNIELAVTGFGDSISVAPDSFLIGRISLDRLDTTQAINVDWFVNGTAGTVVYLDDEATVLNPGNLKGLSIAANCPPQGSVCDDGDSTTINDMYDANCNCVGTACPPAGTVCDDGDSTTTNDMYDASCNCVGTPCPVAGTTCDDGNANTINDVEDGMCNCAGTPLPPPPPGTPATAFNLCFANPTLTTTTLSADIYMSYDGVGSLGSSNLMFDFDPAIVNNAMYVSDNLSNPPFYLTPTVSSPSAGRGSFNIELAVTGFGDSISIAPDSFLIGRISLDVLDTTQAINVDWFVNGTAGTVVYLDDEATVLNPGNLKGLSIAANCPPQGSVCDDGDSTTINDMYDANCNCVGTACPPAGTVCDDGDSTTTNDMYDASCNCVGTPCPVAGTTCDDGNANTINDVEDGMCNCAGTPLPPPPPGTPATAFNLCFANPTLTTTTLSADIYMSYDGVGSLGSSNLMFDFDPAIVNNAMYVSDNLSNPPFYLTPTVSSPSAGRGSFNIELAVTGFGDSISIAPDSFLIGRISLDVLDTTQAINVDWFVNGTAGTVVYLDDEATVLNPGNLKGLSIAANCPPQGSVCDDGDSTTINDMYDANCNCVGTACPPAGTVCDDGDSTTTNDMYDASCNCVGTPCPVAGTTCDDGNANTINDVEDGMCNCAGTPLPPPPPGTPATAFNLCFANPTLTTTTLSADIYMSYDGVGSLGSSNLMFDFDPAIVNNAMYVSDNLSNPPFYLTPTVSSPSAGRGSFNIELAVTGFGDSISIAPDSFLIGRISLAVLDTTQAINVDWFVNGTAGTVVYLDDEATVLNAANLKGLSIAANCPPQGSVCDDGDSTTINDMYDANCNCVGTACPPQGTVCDDGDSTTTNDMYDASCNCIGTPCPPQGTTCDDGDPNTINDVEDGMCNCAGTPPNVPTATTFDLCFANPSSDGNTFCVDIFMSFDGVGRLGSSNLMFDFDPSLLGNPVYMSDNLSDPPVYLLPTVSSPASGRGSYNIELSIPGFGDEVAVAPDSFLVGSICLNIIDANRIYTLDWFESGSAGTVVYLDNEATILTPGTLKGITYPCMPEGTACDDGDPQTGNDMYDANCNCIGEVCPPQGTTCDDGDSTTINDMEDGFCNCVGTPCPDAGTVCDDGDSTTINDIFDANCNCVGEVCPPQGTTCDDGDSTTINDMEDGMCNCVGTVCPPMGETCDDGDATTFDDTEDGMCNCVGTACPTQGTACDDGDPQTLNDVEDGMCNCAGEIPTPMTPDLWLEGEIVGEDGLLTWTMSLEEDITEYILERSVDSVLFGEVSTTPSLGDTPDPREYDYLDTSLLVRTTYYYRVKVVGEDNSIQYSNVVVLEFNVGDEELVNFNVYPIPLRQDDILHVEFLVSQPSEVTITLVNGAGQLVIERKVMLEVGPNDIEFDIKGLAEGIYFLGAQSANWTEGERVFILDN